MQYQFSIQFLSEIVRLAKEIAFYQRGERKLQDIDTLEEKFWKECKELKESPHPEEEIPDVIYYGVCLAAQGQYSFLRRAQEDILPEYPYSQAQIEAATLAKYCIRAEGPNSKDFKREREAIQSALG